MKAMLNDLLRHEDALFPTAAVLLYVLLGYGGGFALLLSGYGVLWPLGVVLVAHAMVIAAYMVHECAHNAVFRDNTHNARLGRALLWISGGCYGDYEEVRNKHMRHHVDRADVIFMDYRKLLARQPLLRRIVCALEWCYVPAVDVLMHALVMLLPFTAPYYRANRRRVLICLLLRGSVLLVLLLTVPLAVAGYAVAYLLMLAVLRAMDMHQHTYELVEKLADERVEQRFDRAYEQSHTFSNRLGDSALLNVLVLNFGYHNAHHARPTQPWYRLPALDRQLAAVEWNGQNVDFREVLDSYRHHRVARVMNAGERPIGIYGVSFLTAL